MENRKMRKMPGWCAPFLAFVFALSVFCAPGVSAGETLPDGAAGETEHAAAVESEASEAESGLSDPGSGEEAGTEEDGTEAEGSASEEGTVTEEPFIVYLSGSDTRDAELTVSNSDVNILMVVNPSTKNILLLNTPRDYYVQNPAGGNAMDKLTHCGVYGIENSEKALEQLYGCTVDYYMQFNFSGFSDLIDSIGGITVYSDESFTTAHGGYQIVQGYNDLDGEQALGYVRDRYNVAYGDNGRGRDQMYVIEAVFDKIISDPLTMLKNLPSILAGLNETFRTDITPKMMAAMLSAQLTDSSDWNLKTYAVTGHNGQDYTYSMPDSVNDVMYQDEELVAHASDLIQKCEDGTELTDEIVGETVQEW